MSARDCGPFRGVEDLGVFPKWVELARDSDSLIRMPFGELHLTDLRYGFKPRMELLQHWGIHVFNDN